MISYATCTDVGGRKINEDSVGTAETPDGALFALADGLGGHGQGEVASRIAVDTALAVFRESPLPRETLLARCVTEAQQAIAAEQQRQQRLGDMKTTLTLLHISEGSAGTAHVGDSRIYTFRGGAVEARTRDHSVPQMLVLSGEIEEKDIRFHEDRNRLTRALGMAWEEPKYDVSEPFAAEAGMSFLLCSDGFWELIDEQEMEELLKSSETPQAWLGAMAAVVREKGDPKKMDNYSAVAVFVR